MKDPYELLGVGRGASLDEVRTAYHRAAVLCHPDSCPEDRQAAGERFMELTQAYDAICRMQRTFSAVDQAKLDMSWMVMPQQTVHSPEDPSHPPPGMMKVTRPKWDENAVFLFCWALSLAMGLTMLFLADRFGLMEGPAVLFICPLVYFAGLFIGYFLILMSREIVWIVLRFARRALPPPPASPDDPSPSDH